MPSTTRSDPVPLGILFSRAAEGKSFRGKALEDFVRENIDDTHQAARFCARMSEICAGAYDLALTVWGKRRSYDRACRLLRQKYPELTETAASTLMADAMYASK